MIDDDSWFKSEIYYDVFDELEKNNKVLGTGYSWNKVSDRTLDTRINFYKWIKYYVEKYNINIKCKKLNKCINKGENDIIKNRKCNKKFHKLKYISGNFNIINKKIFENKEWKQFLNEFENYRGDYKYRWGDCEVFTLFYYLHFDDDFLDLKLIEKNIYNNKLPKSKLIKNGLK